MTSAFGRQPTWQSIARVSSSCSAAMASRKPVKVKMLISASGSGQMLPLQMNEYIQQNLKAVGIEVEFEVVEWQALLDLWRAGGKSPQIKGAHGVNISYNT